MPGASPLSGRAAPAAPDRWPGDVAGGRLQQPGVVLDAEHVGHGDQQGVGLTDGGVLGQLIGALVGLADVALAGAVLPVEVAGDRQDAAAHRHPRRPLQPASAQAAR